MKYIKVKINKIRTDWQTDFKYPKLYNAKTFEIVSYENKWNNIEYAIATTSDDFIESEWLIELNLWQAKQYIKDFTNNDKDIKDTALLKEWKTIQDIMQNKHNMLWI